MSDPTVHCHQVLPAGSWQSASDLVVLRHDQRRLQRCRLETASGLGFRVEMPEPVTAQHGDALPLSNGQLVEVIAADEDLVAVRGDLKRLAWHIGRHGAACQTAPERLLMPRNAALERSLAALGATLEQVCEPFCPDCDDCDAPHAHAATAGRRHVHVHVAHLADADDDDEMPEVPAANA